jgi:decaprenyl-phosphate phosphoribosyltransferase
MAIKSYISMARPDHWFKNVLIIPGFIIAILFTQASPAGFILPLILGVMSACLISSANYLINEWIDAEFDKHHPVKKNRPAVADNVSAKGVYIAYAVCATVGLLLGYLVNMPFFYMSLFLLIMGFFYNVRPFRTKDRVYLDVLSESVNSPIRLAMGWYVVTTALLPPASFVIAYWMGGSFLMTIKRYAEYRFINDPDRAGLYRRSFRYYTEEKLLIASFFYSLCAALFLGVFLIKHRVELLVSFPFLAALFVWYLHIGMKADSAAQAPEKLYHEKKFMAYVTFVGLLMAALLVLDLPWLHVLLTDTFGVQ